MAPNTWRTYSAAWKSYHTFTLQTGLVSFPLSPYVLQLYVTQASCNLRFNTIKVYISALKFINTFYGFDSTHVFSDELFYLLRGIRRSQAVALPNTPSRIPISPAHLQSLFRYVDNTCSVHDARCYRAAFTLAFFALLRVSEFTCPTSCVFDPSLHLSLADVHFSSHPTILHIRIKQSKTDPFRQGCVLRAPRIDHFLCPVLAMRLYLLLRPTGSGPLFVLQDGSFLTRAHVSRILTNTFPFASPGSISTHSFRIGGASMLCSLGVPDATIQILGRWSSNVFRRYLHISDQYLTEVHQRGASSTMSFARIWDPQSTCSKPKSTKR